ncbi:MAG: glycine--tRNA ligase subunit beta [Bradymonadaceae bacterium]
MELIFEIGCEELPASFIEPALEQMRTRFIEACAENRVEVDGVRLLATPRRLTLLVSNLTETQADLQEERTGPPAQVAFRDGQPTKAAEGFARGQGVGVEDLYVLETEKGAYVAAKVFEKGGPVTELLPTLLEKVLESLHFPKSMRWANYKETFARPVRWLLAVADGKRLPMTFAGVESGITTRGHRFAAPGEFVVRSIADYDEQLSSAHVVVDPDERRKCIETGLAAIGKELGGRVIDDPGLLNEVVYLVEDPHALYLSFDPKYLEVPDEVLISSMRSHQRYFAIAGPDGRLLPNCAVIYNTAVRNPDVVAQGNLKVLKARLDDARFFWEKDLQKTLAERVDELDRVVWLQKIGSMKARSERMSVLAEEIAATLGLAKDVQDTAARAAYLAKADLVSHMVGEFPDLQGVMGREYALKQGEPEDVARAIYEQYLPRGADDELPTTDAGACVAIAERLDAIVGCFSIGLIPTASADPYALRRAALGVLRIIQERNYQVHLSVLIEAAMNGYGDDTAKNGELAHEILEFLATRLRFQLNAHLPTDVVDAVLAAGYDDVLSVQGRADALATLRDLPDFETLAMGFKRVVNILKKQAEEYAGQALEVDEGLFKEAPEEMLHVAYEKANDQVEDALGRRDWKQACESLIALKAPVDDFFDHVMVMTDDEALKKNRIALLSKLRELFMQVADISVIQ